MPSKLILVVDDDAVSRVIIQGFLQGEPKFTVATVDNGLDCLSYLEENKVDLIISDVEMGGLDGLEMSNILLSQEATSEIPIILSSIRDKADISIECRHINNVKKVVQKPYSREHLLHDLNNILSL
jgi:CheY-like chemotaxis protein